MPEQDNEARPTGPNADVPRGAPPKAPNAIAEGKGPISFPEPTGDKTHVDGMRDANKDPQQQPQR
jgi:hypothetical protein